MTEHPLHGPALDAAREAWFACRVGDNLADAIRAYLDARPPVRTAEVLTVKLDATDAIAAVAGTRKLVEAVAASAVQFGFYAREHTAKGATEKAETNARLRDLCRAALP